MVPKGYGKARLSCRRVNSALPEDGENLSFVVVTPGALDISWIWFGSDLLCAFDAHLK
jgi:hypothetical protein